MKKLLFISTFLFASVFSFAPAFAQSASTTQSFLVATVNLTNARIASQSGRNFVLSFNISNRVGAQSSVEYAVELTAASSSTNTALDTYLYPDIFSLGENMNINKTINYSIPNALPAGSYKLWIQSQNTSGLMFGTAYAGEATITASSANAVFIAPACALSTSGTSTIFSLASTDTITAKCSVTSNVAGTFTPTFVTRANTAFGETASQTGGSTSTVAIHKGANNISVVLPKAANPGNYNVAFSLLSSDGTTTSNTVSFVYGIAGQIGSIQNAIFDKTYYNAGDTANLQIFSIFSGIGSSTITALVSDETGVSCALPATVSASDFSVQTLSIPITKNCIDPKASITLSSNGSVLDAKDFQVTGATSTSVTTSANMKGIVSIVIIVIVLLLLIFLITRMKGKNKVVANMMIILLFVSISLIGSAKAAKADTWSYNTEDCYNGCSGTSMVVNFYFSLSYPNPAITTGSSVFSSTLWTNHNNGYWYPSLIEFSPTGCYGTTCPSALQGTNSNGGSEIYVNNNSSLTFSGGTQPYTASISFNLWTTAQGNGAYIPAEYQESLSFPVVPPAASVSIAADGTGGETVASGQSVTLSYSAQNTNSYTLSGGISGTYPGSISGTTITVNPTSNTTYTIAGSGQDGSNPSQSVTVDVTTPPPTPTLSFIASPTIVNYNGTTTLSWSSANSSSCTASSTPATSWTGSVAPLTSTSTQSVGSLTADTTFNLTCTDTTTGGSVSSNISVIVEAGPETPTNVSAAPDANACEAETVSWADAGDDGSYGYYVSRNGSPITSGACSGLISGTTCNDTDSALQGGTSYYYQVQASKGGQLSGTSSKSSSIKVSGPSFAAVGASLSLTSPDAAAWTRNTAITGSWNSVASGNGLFVAVSSANNTIMTSANGINWTSETGGTTGSEWTSITYGNGLFAAVGINGSSTVSTMTSPDGVNWTQVNENNGVGLLHGVTYGNGLFVAVAHTGTVSKEVMTSPDGVTWTLRTIPEADAWQGVTYGNGLFVAVASSGTHRVMTSPDGITWTSETAAGANAWFSVTYGNGLFAAVSTDGDVMTSPDGVTWTMQTSAGAGNWQSVTYANGLFVAVSSVRGIPIMTSPDGINWTLVASSAGANAVIYGGGGSCSVQSVAGTCSISQLDGPASTSDVYVNKGVTWSTTIPGGLMNALVNWTGTNISPTQTSVGTLNNIYTTVGTKTISATVTGKLNTGTLYQSMCSANTTVILENGVVKEI